jgi:hypothetical protein
VASYEKRPATSDETRSYQLTADGYWLSAVGPKRTATSYEWRATKNAQLRVTKLEAIGLIIRTNSILGTLPPLDVNENRLKAADGCRLSAVGSKLRVPKRPAASYETLSYE